MEVVLIVAVLLGIVNLLTRPSSKQVEAETPAVHPKSEAVTVELLVEKGEAIAPPPVEEAPVSAQPPLKPEPRSTRREQVWAILDGAPEGASASELIALVKTKTGQGTSKATIQAWRKARLEQCTPENQTCTPENQICTPGVQAA